MELVYKIGKEFWKSVKKSDTKRLSTQFPPKNIKEINDIPYICDGDLYHLLDVYYPETAEEKLPVIIDIHGGGWMYGDKELNKIYCMNLAERGFLVFNISYRLVPSVTVNEQLQDIARALRWISENMKNYPCDSKNIMLTGDSAGGQLAAYSAMLTISEEMRNIFDTVDPQMKLDALTLTSPVAYMNSSSPMSVYTSSMWGKNFREKKTYPYMNLSDILPFGQLPPTVLITSSGDLMALEQTKRAYADLRKYSADAKLINFPKFEGKHLPHVFSVIEPQSKAGKIAIDEFISFYKKIIAEKETVTN